MTVQRLCLPVLAAALVAGFLLAGAAPAAAATRTVTYRMGPIPMGGYQTLYNTENVRHPKINGSVSYMHARVVDAKGRFVPQHVVMLHHVAFVNDGRFDGDKSQFYCEQGHKERFYGTGEEDQSLVLPPGYGYHVRKSDRWHASWMLMNHKFTSRTVYIEYTMKITDGWKDIGVTPYWLGVAPCPRDPIFHVPGGGAPGSRFAKSIDWTPPVDGRIVAVGTHVHGGATSMRITEPACGNRTIAGSEPEYGLPDDPIYHVLPQIHEPSPRFTSYPLTATGIPIRKGRRYRVSGVYDNAVPHARVMAIMHAYVAPATKPVSKCAPLPTDVRTLHYDKPYRTVPPEVYVPLTMRDRNGRAKPVKDLPGNYFRPDGDAMVKIEGLTFNHQKVVIDRGRAVRWIFNDPFVHDVTTANGPTAFGSQHLKNGQGWHRKFTRPGTYRVYCTLHPVDMHQIIKVR
jgi:hypothetical protein